MKKIITTILSVAFIWSCSFDPEINVDQKNPPVVSAATLFTNGTRTFFDWMNHASVNNNVFRLYAQYWSQTTYPDESQYNQVIRNIGRNMWNAMYRDVLKDLDGARLATEVSVDNPNKEQQLQAIEFMTVYAYSFLVDTFGNVPYSEALDSDNSSPKYDDAKTIYLDLLKRLDTAIEKMDDSASLGFTDIVYNGGMKDWKTAANSLLLRMAMRIAESNPTESQDYAEKAAKRDLIVNNSQNFSIKYKSAAPNTHPLWVTLVQSGRSDYVAANTIVDILQPRVFETKTATVDMNGDKKVDEKDTYTFAKPGSFSYTDPRTVKYFDNNEVIPNKLVIKDADKNVVETIDYTFLGHKYKGGIYGSANSYSLYTHLGVLLKKPDLEGTIISAAEVNFLLAEAAARTYSVSGTTQSYYNAGVTASFDEWEVEGAATYLTEPHVNYTTALANATGGWKEVIGTQKWIALYNNGFEGWTTWRLLGSPKLNAPKGLTVADIPTRFLYPLTEATLNGEQYQAAAAAIGGDKKTTPLFWDKN